MPYSDAALSKGWSTGSAAASPSHAILVCQGNLTQKCDSLVALLVSSPHERCAEMGVVSLGDSLTETQQLACKHRLHTTLCTSSNVEFIWTWFHINLKWSHCTLPHIATQSANSEALGRSFGPCQVLVLA